MADNGHKIQIALVTIVLGNAKHQNAYTIMMVADALVPKRHLAICNHHADSAMTRL